MTYANGAHRLKLSKSVEHRRGTMPKKARYPAE